MPRATGTRRFALAAFFALAGCASASTQAPSTGSLPALSPMSKTNASATTAATATRTLYVSDINANAVFVFNANNITAGPLNKITAGINRPGALAVAPNGDLYVTNGTGQNVTVYRPGTTTPFKTLKSTDGTPGLIAFAADGSLAIAYGRGFNRAGTLVVYDRGSATPTRSIFIPLGNNLLLLLRGLAFDRFENLYLSVSRYPRGPAQFLKYPRGSSTPVNTGLAVDDGIAIDSAGDIYSGETFSIAVERQGANNPLRVIKRGVQSTGFLAVESDGTLFLPNTESYAFGDGNLVEYASGGSIPIATFKSPEMIYPVAAALSP